jgi:hypothetical protein
LSSTREFRSVVPLLWSHLPRGCDGQLPVSHGSSSGSVVQTSSEMCCRNSSAGEGRRQSAPLRGTG